MKKIITSIILLLVIALSFTSCELLEEKFGDPLYNQLNTLANSEHGDYAINVTITDKNTNKLTENYTVTTAENGNATINYTVERLNKFIINESTVTPPISYKQVLTGYAVVNGENLFELSGDNVDVDFTKLTLPTFKFSKNTLSNVVTEEGTLTADVISQNDFLGFTLTEGDVALKVEFDEAAIHTVTLTFETAAENNVTLVYTFN